MKLHFVTRLTDRWRGRSPISSIFMLAACLSLVFVGGCFALSDDDAGAASQHRNCETNTQCPASQKCRDCLCSTPFEHEPELDFRFLPPSSSDFVRQVMRGVPLHQSGRIDFGLERGITVSSGEEDEDGEPLGGVRYAGESDSSPSGTLVFQPHGVDDGAFVREAEVDDGEFSIQLTPGRYAITFVPEDLERHPKTTWPDEQFEQNTELELTVPSNYIEIDGTIVRNALEPGSDRTNQEKVANAQVYAISRDGAHTSTVATTDEEGDFRLRVQPDTGWYDVYVVGAEPDLPMPSNVYERVFEANEQHCVTQAGVADNPCQLSNQDLGTYPAETIEILVALVSDADLEDDPAWAGTNLIVEGELGDGRYQGKFPVDQDGQAQIELYPSNTSHEDLPDGYTLEVIPPANSSLARTRFELADVAFDRVNTFKVAQKPSVEGHIWSSTGEPLDAAHVEFRQLPEAGEPAGDERSFKATTDEDGSFEAWLEIADYQVRIAPAETSGQPRTVTYLDAEQIEQAEPLDIELPAPSVILGTVLGAQDATNERWTPVEQVVVEAYRQVDGRTVVFGQARTNQDGHFRMALPGNLE